MERKRFNNDFSMGKDGWDYDPSSGGLKNVAWELFQKTGMIGYYNLYKDLEE